MLPQGPCQEPVGGEEAIVQRHPVRAGTVLQRRAVLPAFGDDACAF